MAEGIEVRVDARLLNEAIAKVPGKLFQEVSRELLREMRLFESELIETRLSGDPLKVRSGSLRRSWKTGIEGNRLENLYAWTASTSKAAATHEFGDPNRKPRTAKMLAIPLDAAKFPSGTARYNSPLRQTLDGEFSKTWVARMPSGKLILFGQKGQTGGAIPLFVLVPSVSIPARMGARTLFAKRAPRFGEAVSRGCARALDDLGVSR